MNETGPGIGFIGSGQMATALAKAWTTAGLIDSARSVGSDSVAAAREKFTAVTGLKTVAMNKDAVASVDVVLLAVKPQMMPVVLTDLKSAIAPTTLVVSIAAGITLKQLTEGFGSQTRLIRVMPNTPCLVNASATGSAAGTNATPDDIALVAKLFGAVGKAYPVPEHLLDAVTGLSGSGPAYVYMFIEALADGGVKMGLPRDVALSLAAQTVLGGAKMILETGTHPATLKDAVTSPGGTTIAGLHALEKAGFRSAVIDAVEAATKRATELGQKS
ncbi:pyrroline-5-carboxylate reductase [soil metagenome]